MQINPENEDPPLCRKSERWVDTVQLFLRDSLVIWTFFTMEVLNYHFFPNDIGDLGAVMRHALVLNLCFAFRMAFDLLKKPSAKQANGEVGCDS